jgi:HD superfamily phosphohydrolase
MDADKIDYISRDTFFSGVSTTIDVDRLFNELLVHTFKSGLNALVVSSPLPLERLLFSKVLLYTTLYHHQKVLAADCMISGMLEYVQRPDTPSLNGRKFTNVVDFLSFTDYDILGLNREKSEDRFVNDILRDLSGRNLWQRCLVISRETVDNYDSRAAYLINRLSQSPAEMLELRKAIYERLPAKDRCSQHEVWVSLPEQPSLREATQTLALLPGEKEPVKLNDIFPLDGWLRAFSDNKWKGYVFGPSKLQKEISKAATEVLQDYGLRLNQKSVAYARVS